MPTAYATDEFGFVGREFELMFADDDLDAFGVSGLHKAPDHGAIAEELDVDHVCFAVTTDGFVEFAVVLVFGDEGTAVGDVSKRYEHCLAAGSFIDLLGDLGKLGRRQAPQVVNADFDHVKSLDRGEVLKCLEHIRIILVGRRSKDLRTTFADHEIANLDGLDLAQSPAFDAVQRVNRMLLFGEASVAPAKTGRETEAA